MKYCLDSNFFIESKKGPYAFDIAPGFWQWLDLKIESGEVFSSEMVYQELEGGGDDLATWVRARRTSGLFEVPNSDAQTALKNIVAHVNATYTPANAKPFLGGADPWVIAQAITCNGTVVTHEKIVPANSSRVKIPNVCNAFNALYMGPFEALRVLGLKLVL